MGSQSNSFKISSSTRPHQHLSMLIIPKIFLKPKMSPLISLTLIAFLPALINSLPESVSGSCSSQTCQDCLGSCGGCDQCSLCNICPEKLSICAKCKYCKNGVEACKKSCNSGKLQPVCQKCINNCS